MNTAGVGGGGGRLRRLRTRTKWPPIALAACALAICADGCQSTQEKSAQLEKSAKHERLALQGVSVSKQSPDVQTLRTEVVHGHEGNAVIVRLRDSTSKPILAAPIEITALDAKGKVIYQNNAPGEDQSLTKVSLQPGAEGIWIDDQVHTETAPASANAKVGEGTHPSGQAPKLTVEGLHVSGEGSEANTEGSVKNQSSTTQNNLVVFVVARKGGKVVAAGRAVLPEVLPGASDSFQIYFVGDPSGAKLEASAPPTTF